jgi:metallophosphoesterase superfamily enzyme
MLHALCNRLLFHLLERPLLPAELRRGVEAGLLHVSDIPSDYYGFVYRLIETLQPAWLVHTGDLADEIKLELDSSRLPEYRKRVRRFLAGLERLRHRRKSALTGIYLVPGNHDSLPCLQELLSGRKEITITAAGSLLSLGGASFRVSHLLPERPQAADFLLYGHNFDQPADGSCASIRMRCLNGVTAVNLVIPATGAVYNLPYPAAINRSRKLVRRLCRGF